MATTFSLNQGETRTSHGPIPHPLSDFKPVVIPENFGKVKFVASTDHATEVPPLGHTTHVNPMSPLRSARYEDVRGEWKLEKKFGQGYLNHGVAIATYPSTGNVVVACWKDQIKIFDSDGVFKLSVEVKEGSLSRNLEVLLLQMTICSVLQTVPSS